MRRNTLLISLMIGLLFVSGCGDWKSRLSPSGAIAVNFIDNLISWDYEAAYALFDDDMKYYYVDSSLLQSEWENYIWLLGEYESYALLDFALPSENEQLYSFRMSFSGGKCTLEITIQNDQISEFGVLALETP